jgi:hypothetical protein
MFFHDLFDFVLITTGSVKAFDLILKISPVKINEINSCPFSGENHFGQTWPNLR